jgi:hypothetical protein
MVPQIRSISNGGIMVSEAPSPKSTSTLADRLALATDRRFTGRDVEMQAFHDALLNPDSGISVLLIHGPGGIGKTTLLRQFQRAANEHDAAVVRLDARNFEASPPGMLIALAQELGVDITDRVVDALNRFDRVVLMVDTGELLQGLETWLRETFLPMLPEQVLVVIAGRNPPAPEWRTDSGWSDLARIVPLRNFRPDEADGYLDLRDVPVDQRQSILDFTHGHPLALSLMSDILAQGDDLARFSPRDHPNLVKLLLDRFVSQLPSPRHREALEICAHVRVTTEDLLKATIGDESVDLFAWLRQLSFIEHGREGVFPHDLAREVLDVDLRWRSPERYLEVHRLTRGHIAQRLEAATGIDQQQAFFDLLYLHRNSEIMRPHYDWDSLGKAYADRPAAGDITAILELVTWFEGEESARIARFWLDRQPEAFWSIRSSGGEFLGFMATLALRDECQEESEADPAVAAAWDFTRRYGPVRQGEVMLLHRFMVGRETYQSPSPAANVVSMRCFLDWVGTPGLAWNLIAVRDTDYWYPEFAYLYQQRATEADFTVGGHTYGVFAHDWRAMPPVQWFDLMEQRELTTDLQVDQIEQVQFEPLIVLSQPEFDGAVRQAMRDWNRTDALALNPLLRSRVALSASDGNPDPETLRKLISDAASQLRDHPREARLYRALDATYFRPAETQELAAERLGLPFSTYRYHLTTGIERVAAILWRRELYGTEE